MKDFDEYLQTLPKPLPKEEQESLLNEYYETKDENIRNKLIEHNLRLCVMVAFKFFEHTKDFVSVEELYSECCSHLVRAVELYNPTIENSSSFSYYAITHMEKSLIRGVNEDKLRKLYLLNSVFTISDDEIDLFNTVGHENGEQIVSDLEQKELYEDILKYINNVPEKWREAFKIYIGIDPEVRRTTTELAQMVGLTRQRVEAKLKDLREGLKNYLLKRDPSLKWRDSARNKNKVNETAFNEYYGINGCQIRTGKEVGRKYGCVEARHKLGVLATKYVKSGKYTQEEIDDIKKSRREKAKQRHLDVYEYWYNSYYGLNGFEKKSASFLAFESDYTISGIMAGIKAYKKYLANQEFSIEEEDNEPTAQ